MRSVGSVTATNWFGVVTRRSVSYDVVDGAIAWQYTASYDRKGMLQGTFRMKCDAKEVDPRFRDVMGEVDAEVGEEMKKDGNFRQFGSCHAMWALKKAKLKARGIVWYSPSELNPGAMFD